MLLITDLVNSCLVIEQTVAKMIQDWSGLCEPDEPVTDALLEMQTALEVLADAAKTAEQALRQLL